MIADVLINWMSMSMFSFSMPTSMVRGMWSKGLCISGSRICLPNLRLLGSRKTKIR